MGIFGLHLPKKADEVWSGLDFWDKKENQQQRQQFAAQRPTPTPQPHQDTRNIFQKSWDTVNPIDSGRSWSTPTPSPQQRSNSGWQQVYHNIAEPAVVTPVQHTANTLAAAGAGIIGGANVARQSIFGTDQQYKNAIDSTQGAMNELLDHGWGNKGGFGSSQEFGNADLFGTPEQRGNFLKPVIRGVAEDAPLVVPGGVVARGASLPLRVAAGAGENALVGGASNAGMQYADTGKVNPVEVLKSAGLSGLLGAAPPVAGSVIRGANRAVRVAPEAGRVIIKNSKQLVPQGEGGFVTVGRTPNRIHPEDQGVMSDYIDMQRGTYKPKSDKELLNLETEADHIARRYGITRGETLTPTQLANKFDQRLTEENYKAKGLMFNPITKEWIKDPGAKEGGFIGRGDKTPEKSFKSEVKNGKVIVKPAKNGVMQEVKRGMSDHDQVILDELRSIEKQTGETGLVDKFMYRSNQQRGSNRIANRDLETSQDVKTAIGHQNKGEADAFSEYANARSELSFAKSQKTPTGKPKKISTSRPVEELEATVKGGHKEFNKRFQALNKHYQKLSEMAADAGIIDKKTLAKYKANKDYIRIQRDLDEKIPNATGGRGNGYQLGSTTLKQRRRGSKRQTLDAAEVMAERTQQVHKEVAKNRTGTFLVDTLSKNGLARKVSPSKATSLNTVGVFRNGKKEFYEVSPQVKEAMDNINPYQMNVVMQILAAPGRIFRAGVTGLNPVFIARNLVKDQFGSAINSKDILATHNPKTFFSGLKNASTDLVGANHNELWDDFLKHYGDQTSYDLTRNVKDTRKVVAGIRGGRKVKVVQKITAPIRTLEDIASVTEKSTRFQNFRGAYKKAIKEGMSKDDAMEYAAIQGWQNSVDFSRAGTWGRTINTVIPYWNPATQGVRQMGRTFKDRPVSSGFKAVSLVGVPLAAATAWNLSDPDSKKVYDNIPEYEKDNNLILIPPGTKQNQDGSYNVFKIPLPPGFKDAVMPIRRAMEGFAHDKGADANKVFSDILQTVSGPVQTGSIGQFAGSFIPQGAKPFIQAAANKDFYTGKDIVPDYIDQATDKNGRPIPDAKKAYKNTSGTARKIGDLFGVSPIKVEKFIKDAGGTVGLNVLNASDNALASTGEIPKDQVGGQSVGTGFRRSFGEAQGIENYNKSEGAKYFDRVKKATQGFTQPELAAFNSLHPTSKNFLGDKIYERDAVYDPAARLDIYNRYPKVFQADKKLDASQKIHNPLYQLQNWQVKKVLEKENLPPGAKDPELTNLYQKEWYQNYRNGKTEFFDKLAKQAKKEGRSFGTKDNPYPLTPSDVQRAMDTYSSLPKGTGARSGWIQSNPGMWSKMQQQFAAVDNWQNIARGKRGLDATEGAAGQAAGYGSGSSSSSGGGKSSKFDPNTYIKKYSTGGSVSSGQAKGSGKVNVKARKSGSSGGKIKVTSTKIRLA